MYTKIQYVDSKAHIYYSSSFLACRPPYTENYSIHPALILHITIDQNTQMNLKRLFAKRTWANQIELRLPFLNNVSDIREFF